VVLKKGRKTVVVVVVKEMNLWAGSHLSYHPTDIVKEWNQQTYAMVLSCTAS